MTFVQDSVQPACLPEASFAPDETGVTSYVSGWGKTLECPACKIRCRFHKSSEDLRFVRLPLLTNYQCTVGTFSNCTNGWAPEQITNNMVCAGFIGGGKDTCQVQYKCCNKKNLSAL